MRPPAAPRPPRREPQPASREEKQPVEQDPGPRPRPADRRRTPVPPRTDVATAEAAGPGSLRRAVDRVRRAARPEAVPDGAFGERLTERTRAERRLRWRTVLITLTVLAALAALAWAVFLSPLLALDTEQVDITGTGEDTTVGTEEVAAIIEQHAGTPLPRLGTQVLREQVEALPTVFSVQVHRAWPRGLVVDVVAREPVAAVQGEGRIELLDVEGVTVGTAEEVPEGMALVDVSGAGERSAQTLDAVLTVLSGLPEELRAEVAVAGAGSPAAITLELVDGAEVRWGGAEEIELKAAVLEVLRAEPAAVYDVTVPRSPTIAD